MNRVHGLCPLSGRAMVDAYFIENRTRILELAAFLDRLERAADGPASDDYRLAALQEAIVRLAEGGPHCVRDVQMIFSDPRLELLDALDQKSANGAFDRNQLEVR